MPVAPVRVSLAGARLQPSPHYDSRQSCCTQERLLAHKFILSRGTGLLLSYWGPVSVSLECPWSVSRTVPCHDWESAEHPLARQL